MLVNTREKEDQQNNKLTKLLWKEKKEELAKILVFWEKLKPEWERKKKEFWKEHNREDYIKLLKNYNESKTKFMWWLSEDEKNIINKMSWVTREKFFEEYLHDLILYSWDKDEKPMDFMIYSEEFTRRPDLWPIKMKEGNVVLLNNFWAGWDWVALWLKETVTLNKNVTIDLSDNEFHEEWFKYLLNNKFFEWINLRLYKDNIWPMWAKYLSKIELSEWMILDLAINNIWPMWAQYLSKIKLKDNVELNLKDNEIWDEWAKYLSKMIMKEGVYLNLQDNWIWSDWAKYLSNMNLKIGNRINLENNSIWPEWAKYLSKMKFKEATELDLKGNEIWAEWAKYLSEIELKEWMVLNLSYNDIWVEGIEYLKQMELKDWVKIDLSDYDYKATELAEEWWKELKKKNINCEIITLKNKS